MSDGLVTQGGLNRANSPRVVVESGATATITAARHGSKVVRIGLASGQAFTLPAATGSGILYRLINNVTITSNSTTVKVANSSDIMQGLALTVGSAAATFKTAADSDTITLNGTTTGGAQKGDYIELIDFAPNTWFVRVSTLSSGTAATPFSATV